MCLGLVYTPAISNLLQVCKWATLGSLPRIGRQVYIKGLIVTTSKYRYNIDICLRRHLTFGSNKGVVNKVGPPLINHYPTLPSAHYSSLDGRSNLKTNSSGLGPFPCFQWLFWYPKVSGPLDLTLRAKTWAENVDVFSSMQSRCKGNSLFT